METIEDLITLNETIENLKCGVISRYTIEILERLGQVIIEDGLPDTFNSRELESLCR